MCQRLSRLLYGLGFLVILVSLVLLLSANPSILVLLILLFSMILLICGIIDRVGVPKQSGIAVVARKINYKHKSSTATPYGRVFSSGKTYALVITIVNNEQSSTFVREEVRNEFVYNVESVVYHSVQEQEEIFVDYSKGRISKTIKIHNLKKL